ncbi:MAG: hypothetical protein NVSMB19_14080 [Vulcanimicrobiaceae bacterium]
MERNHRVALRHPVAKGRRARSSEGATMLRLRLGIASIAALAVALGMPREARADCSTRFAYGSGIVFVTDREPLADDRIFGGERARGDTGGGVVTTGTLTAPRPAKTRGCTSPLAFYKAIQHRFVRGHGRRVLVYVHGYYTSFVHAAADALALKRATHFPGTVVLYSWPATVTAKPAYGLETRNAAWSAAHFASFLAELERHFPRTQVSFVGDGVGARFATAGIGVVRGKNCARCFDRAVLVAPEIAGDTLRRKLQAAHLCARGARGTRDAAAVTVDTLAARARAACGDVDTVAVDAVAFATRDRRATILVPRIAHDVREALAGTPPTAPPRRLGRARGHASYVLVRR